MWQLRGERGNWETRAVRLIGVTFFALAAYLDGRKLSRLVSHAPRSSPSPGLPSQPPPARMPGLAVAKRRTGKALDNRALIADSAETAFCAFTSAAALIGVGLNA